MFRDAELHPLLMAAHLLGCKLKPFGQLWLTECPNEFHKNEPRLTRLLNMKTNRFYCHRCQMNGGPTTFASCVLNSTDFVAAKWIINNCQILPPVPEKQSSFHMRPDYDANAPPWPGEKRRTPSRS